jgi:hypothetical protein
MILYGPAQNVLMRETSITRVSGRGLGLGKRDFFGPCEMTSFGEFHLGAKEVDVSRAISSLFFSFQGMLLDYVDSILDCH